MQGSWTFEYALAPHAGDWTRADLAGQAQEFQNAAMLELGDRHNASFIEGVSTPVPREGSLPDQFSLIDLGAPELVLTAFKRAEKGEDWIIRFYNQTPRDVVANITFFRDVKGVWLSDLAEQRKGECIARETAFSLPVRGKQIITLAIN